MAVTIRVIKNENTMRSSLLLGSLILIFSACSSSQYSSLGMEEEDLPVGLAVGETVENGVHTDQLDRQASIPAKGKYTVVFFYRGSWCPYCSRQMKALSDSLQYITDRGAQVIAITPQAEKEEVMEMSDYVNDRISIVVDSDGDLMRYYDVDFRVTDGYQNKISLMLQTDLAETNDQEVVELPVPATYIIDKNGVIVWRYFDTNYRERATTKQILDNLPG